MVNPVGVAITRLVALVVSGWNVVVAPELSAGNVIGVAMVPTAGTELERVTFTVIPVRTALAVCLQLKPPDPSTASLHRCHYLYRLV